MIDELVYRAGLDNRREAPEVCIDPSVTTRDDSPALSSGAVQIWVGGAEVPRPLPVADASFASTAREICGGPARRICTCETSAAGGIARFRSREAWPSIDSTRIESTLMLWIDGASTDSCPPS